MNEDDKSIRLKLMEEVSSDEVKKKVKATMAQIKTTRKQLEMRKKLLFIIELSKFIFGLLLILIAAISGIMFLLASFQVLRYENWHFLYLIWTRAEAPNSAIFLGICAITGAYLMINTKIKTEE